MLRLHRTSLDLSRACVGAAALLLIGAVACAPSAAPSPAAAPAKPAAQPTSAPAQPLAKVSDPTTMRLDELYEKAKSEGGGKLSYYGTLAQVNAERLFPIFKKRFPGLDVDHIEATADKLVARIVSEARGGKVFADVFEGQLHYLTQVYDQKLLSEHKVPESDAYPEGLKGSYWTAVDQVIIIGAWNTNLVTKEEEPKSWEDFADPRWKGRLIGEPRDAQLLIGLTRKYNDEAKAVDVLKKIAANQPEFHKGHSELTELLVAGQGAACFTCYAHQYPSRQRKGAPVAFWLTEGIAQLNGSAVLKDPPHPHLAMLWHRWIISEEGQRAMAEAGRIPPYPNVQATEPIKPQTIFPLTAEDEKQFSRYERVWKDIFQLR
jgi:iron(III) transport system substrate-binding protein